MADEPLLSGPMLNPERLTPTGVRAALKAGRAAAVTAALEAMPPARRAELFIQLRTTDQKTILTTAPPEMAAQILVDCDSATLSHSLAHMDLLGLDAALRLVPPDALADILLHLPSGKSLEVQGHLDAELRGEVQRLMVFDEKSAGGLMTPRYLSVPDAVTVGRALELLRRSPQVDGASYVYVVDTNGRLTGTVPLRRLLLGEPRQPIRSIASTHIVSVRASASRDEVARMFDEHRFLALPVVDDKDRLLGIVTSQAITEAVRQAAGTVVRGITGVDPQEGMRQTLAAMRSRIPWATVTILGGLACAFIGGVFQATLEEMVVLGIFIPIVLALGESIGAQTVSVMLTTMGTGGRATRELLLKEMAIGALVGVYGGLAVAATSLLWHGNPRLGLVIGGAIAISVAWAAAMGAVVPSTMRRLRVNPAIASGPLVLALADVSTLVVYFGGAKLLMPYLR